jgi:peptidase M48-like protein
VQRAAVLLLFVCPAISIFAQQNRDAKPLVNADVITMVKSGLSAEVVIAKIKSSTCAFDTSPKTLADLKTSGIPDAVILAVVQCPTAEHESGNSAAPQQASTAQVKCGPRDVDRLMFKEVETIQSSGKVSCGEQVEILSYVQKNRVYEVRRSAGQTGYLLEDAIGPPTALPQRRSSSTAEVASPAPPKKADSQKDCSKYISNSGDSTAYNKCLSGYDAISAEPKQPVSVPTPTISASASPTMPAARPIVPRQKKTWPNICLTKGCNLQMIALAGASIGGDVYMAKNGQANMIQTPQAIRQQIATIEAPFISRANSEGYVPYSAIPPYVDKVTNADRSLPVSAADVEFVTQIIDRIRTGPYRVTNFKWTLVPTRVVNSSAFPDPPFVFVYTSILDLSRRDPDQIAFVISHEIGHTIDAQSCSGSGSPFNASFGIPLIQNQFQKFCENHADNVGLQLAAGAGFDPTGAIKLFQELQGYQDKTGMSNGDAFLSNHPLNSSRIQNVKELEPIIANQVQKFGN